MLIVELEPATTTDDLSFGQFYRRVRASVARLRETPVILFTSHSPPDEVIRGLMAGADGYIAKPIDVATFAGQVEAHQRVAGRRAAVAHGGGRHRSDPPVQPALECRERKARHAQRLAGDVLAPHVVGILVFVDRRAVVPPGLPSPSLRAG